MSEFIVSNKTITVFVVIFIIVAAIIGVISYNLGVNYGLKHGSPSSPTAETNQPTNTGNEITNNDDAANSEEIIISGAPSGQGQLATLSGQVTAVRSGGFTLETVTQTFNQQTGKLTETKSSYQVTATGSTKITQVESAVKFPPQGGPAQVTTSIKNSSLSQIKVGSSVTVTTTSDLATKLLTATEINISS